MSRNCKPHGKTRRRQSGPPLPLAGEEGFSRCWRSQLALENPGEGEGGVPHPLLQVQTSRLRLARTCFLPQGGDGLRAGPIHRLTRGKMGSVPHPPDHLSRERERKDLRGLAFAKPPWQIQEREAIAQRRSQSGLPSPLRGGSVRSTGVGVPHAVTARPPPVSACGRSTLPSRGREARQLASRGDAARGRHPYEYLFARKLSPSNPPLVDSPHPRTEARS
jgi:hypothetical protein